MNYYEKIIQDKRNARDYDDINKVYKEAKRIVDDLRRKYREISGRERDDGNFLYSIIEEKGMPTDSGDQQKAKHAAGLLESVRRMSTSPRDWGNSKGETNMGYYADLIKQKQEKRNYRETGKMEEFRYEIEDTNEMGGIFYRGVLRDKTNQIFFATEWDKSKDRVKRELQEQARYYSRKNSKDNENFHYLGKTFSVTSGNFQQVRQQVQKAYWDKVKELEVKLRSAEGSEKQRIEKELREIREGYTETLEEFDRFNNEKEEGYYAKLIEEKASRKH